MSNINIDVDGDNIVGKKVDENGNTVYVVREPIRKLSKYERQIYSESVYEAVIMVPAFRDGIALLNPFYDYTAATAYTDRYARVGLSPWFFSLDDKFQRATILLHEVMHVLNNHFEREDAIGMAHDLRNLSGDLEINTGLRMLDMADISMGIYPGKAPFLFPDNLSMEQYYHLMNTDEFREENPQFFKKNKPYCEKHNPKPQTGDSDSQDDNSENNEDNSKGNGSSESQDGSKSNGNNNSDEPNCTCGADGEGDEDGDGSSDGGAHTCDEASEDRENAADKAGIDRASSVEQNVVKKNVLARIIEHRKSTQTRGGGSADAFLKLVEMRMSPPKVKWQSILNRVLSHANDSIVRGRMDYSYRRPNRRFQDSKYIFPGMVKYVPKLMFAFDTSGSMGLDDYKALLLEVEGIIKAATRGKDNLAVFPIDTEVKNIQYVKTVKEIDVIGGGGTDMSVAVAYVNSLPAKKKPNIFVLATDGYTDWNVYYQEVLASDKKYVHILLITTRGGFDSVPDHLKKICTVIDISDDDNPNNIGW